MLKRTFLFCAALSAIRVFHEPPDDDKSKTGDSAGGGPPVARVRQPLEELVRGDEGERRWRQAVAAADLLQRQEQQKADASKREPQPTKTAEEIFREGLDREKADPKLPTAGSGQTINGVYVPTVEEIAAAGYPNPVAYRAGVLREAERAGAVTGQVLDRVPPVTPLPTEQPPISTAPPVPTPAPTPAPEPPPATQPPTTTPAPTDQPAGTGESTNTGDGQKTDTANA